MTHFKDLAAKVRPLIGTSFGHYGASDKAIKENYKYVKSDEGQGEGSTTYSVVTYADENGNPVATTQVEKDGEKTKYTIFDHTTEFTYASEWGKKSNTKFSSIKVGDYTIFDSNNNGKVDESDFISWTGVGAGVSQTLGSLLGRA